MKKPLLDRLGATLGARLLMAGANFGLFWFLSHRFDMASLGAYSLLMNLFFMLQALPLLGLSLPLERRAAAAPATLASEISHALLIALPMGVLLMLALAVYGHLVHGPALFTAFCLLGLTVAVSAWVLVAESALYGREEMTYIARAQCAEAALRTACAVAAVAAGAGLTGVMLVILLLRIGLALVYARSARLPRPSAALLRKPLWRRNLSEIPVFCGIALLSGVVARADLLVLEHVGGTEQVATYTVSARLYEAALMLPTVVAIVLLPALSRLHASDLQRFTHSLGVMLRGVAWLGMPLALAVAALAQPLIDWLYPPQYAAAAAVLRWLMLAAMLTALDQVLSSAMLACEAQQQDLRSLLASTLVLGAAFLLLVPAFGPAGVAAGVVAALAARLTWRLRWAFARLAPAGWSAHLAKVGGCGLAGTAGLWFGLAHGPWQALTLALGSLLLAGLLCGEISRYPWRDLGRFRQGLAASGLD